MGAARAGRVSGRRRPRQTRSRIGWTGDAGRVGFKPKGGGLESDRTASPSVWLSDIGLGGARARAPCRPAPTCRSQSQRAAERPAGTAARRAPQAPPAPLLHPSKISSDTSGMSQASGGSRTGTRVQSGRCVAATTRGREPGGRAGRVDASAARHGKRHSCGRKRDFGRRILAVESIGRLARALRAREQGRAKTRVRAPRRARTLARARRRVCRRGASQPVRGGAHRGPCRHARSRLRR